ncbi:hypothetical protein ACFLTI_07905 [Bacteroidota bacterium]
MKVIITILFFSLQSIVVLAQNDSSQLVKYSPDFIFTEGIYLNFLQVKNNKPIQKARILSNDNLNDFNFFKNLVDKQMVFYYDEMGIRQEVNTNKIWGYSKNGALFINYNGDYNRIPVIGSICHFISNVTVTTDNFDRFNDPYYYDRYGFGNYYNPYYSNYYPTRSSRNEMKQYLLDFSTGQIVDYNRTNVEVLLMADSELYDEYQGLKRRKKKQMMFYYLRKYNEKHPLFFSINE